MKIKVKRIMTWFFLTLGFDTSALTRCLVRENLDKEDTVIIFRPSGEKDDRGKRALRDVEDFLSKIGDLDLRVQNLHPATPYKSAIKIINKLQATNQRRVVGITGGGRGLVLPMVISIITMSDKIDKFYGFSDVDRRLRKFRCPNLLFQPDDKDLAILELTDEYQQMDRLATELDLSQSTISRRCSKLKENQLLESKKKGKNKFFKITTPGQMILKIYKGD